jgi:leucyl aminopeptidase (aminopeptidase T)
LAPHFKQADGIEVVFSTGHRCYFDISNHTRVYEDNGLLPPGLGPDGDRFANLPAGEVCTCPNETAASKTAGEVPAVVEDESVVFIVEKHEIVDVVGESRVAARLQQEFESEKALRNIAEVAIGCNDKAVVTGNVLEDEKAGFHWAYGRSDHLGGTVGVSNFSSPDKVQHQDIVYAKDSPIVCSRLDFVFPDGERRTAIVDGELKVQ